MPLIPIDVIHTGSSGNCAEVGGDILIDLGVRKSLIPNETIDRISALFITHRHGDHVVATTLKWFAERRPELIGRQVFMNADTQRHLMASPDVKVRMIAQQIPSENVVNHKSEFDIRTRSGVYHVRCFECLHADAETQGYVFTAPNGESILWATDTETLDFAPDEMYDYLCVEGNWDEGLLYAALRDPELHDRASSNLRHYSVQCFEKYVKAHAKEGAVVVQLHESAAFGRRSKVNSILE